MLLASLFAFLLLAFQVSASHFRFASIAWTQRSTLTYEFTVTLAYRSGYSGFAGTGPFTTENLNFGDGAIASLKGTPQIVKDAAGSSYSLFTITIGRTYAKAGSYTAYIDTSARIAGLVNGDQKSWQVQTTLQAGGLATTSPRISSTVYQQISVNNVNVFTLANAGGVGARTCALTPISISHLTAQPTAGTNVISVAPDCSVTWDLTGYTNPNAYFGFSVTVTDSLGNSAITDMLLLTVTGALPVCTIDGIPDGSTLTVQAGSPAVMRALGKAADGSALAFSPQGLPADATFSADATVNSQYAESLNWTPGIAYIGKTVPISFSYAQISNGLQCVKTFYIHTINTAPRVTTCAPPIIATSGSDQVCTLAIPDLVSQSVFSGTNLQIIQSPEAGKSASTGTTPITINGRNDVDSDSCVSSFTCNLAVFAPKITSCPAAISSLSASDQSCTLGVPDFTGNAAASGTNPSFTQSPAAGSVAIVGQNNVILTATNSAGDDTCVTSFQCSLAIFPPVFETCATDISKISGSDTVCDLSISDFTSDPALNVSGTAPITLSQSPILGTQASIGNTSVLLSATNANGTATCQATFGCQLAYFPPIVTTCPLGIAETSASDTVCSLDIPNFLANTVPGGTVPLTLSQSPVAGTKASIGVNNVTISVSNNLGTASCVTTYQCTLNDFPPTVLACPDPVSVNSTSDTVCDVAMPDLATSFVVNGTAPLTMEQTPAVGSIMSDGNTTVSLKVSNDKGSDSCTTSVHCQLAYFDPKITTCPPPVNATSASDTMCSLLLPDFTLTASGSGSAPLVLSQSSAAGTAANVGTNSITITAKNNADTIDTCVTTFECALNHFKPVIKTCAAQLVGNSSRDDVCDVRLPDFTTDTSLDVTGTAPIILTQDPPVGEGVLDGLSSVVITATNGNDSDTCQTTFDCRLAYFEPHIVECPASVAKTSADDKTCTLSIPDFSNLTGFNGTGAVFSQSPAAGSVATVGTNPVSIFAKNTAGTDQCQTSFLCTLADFAPEIQSCAAAITQSTNDSFCTVPDFTASLSLKVNGTSPFVITQTPAVDAQANNGTTSIQIKIANDAGSTSCSTSFVCAVADKVYAPRILTCPSSIAMTSDGNNVCTLPHFLPDVVANGTAPLDLTQTPAKGTEVGVGETNCSISVTNEIGSDECSTVFTCAQADFAPVITSCPDSITYNSADEDSCDMTLPDFTNMASFVANGTAPISLVQSPAARSSLANGSTSVAITATNDQGSATCSTSFTCLYAEGRVFSNQTSNKPVITKCSPDFSSFPPMAMVDLFADFSPSITGQPVGFSACCPSVNVTFVDSVFGSPACTNALAIHRVWTVMDTCFNQTMSQLQMVGINQPKSSLFAGAAPFQLYASTSMSITSSVIAGQLAAAVSLSSAGSILGKSPGNTYTNDTLVAPLLQLQNSQIFYGDAAYSNRYTQSQTSPLQLVRKNVVDFKSTQDALKQQSARLSALKRSLPAARMGLVAGTSTLSLTGQLPFNVFYLSSEQLSSAKQLQIAVPEDSMVLINVNAPHGTISWPATTASTANNNILFNFYGFSSLSVNSGTIKGSILAPSTQLTLGKVALVGGQIAALSINAKGFKASSGSYAGNTQCSWRGGLHGIKYRPGGSNTWIPVTDTWTPVNDPKWTPAVAKVARRSAVVRRAEDEH